MIPIAEIEIDGRIYRLALDLNAMCSYEDETGKSSLAFGQGMTAKDIRAYFRAALLREHPEITTEEVGKMIHSGNLAEVSEKLGELFEDESEESEGGEGKN